MTERENILAALNALEHVEIESYWEMVAAQERHRVREDSVNKVREALRAYDLAHPENVPEPVDDAIDLGDLV